jgi:predicted phosphodiesterase
MPSPAPPTEHRRVAALYDVHGNLPALEAVLAAVDDAAVDAVVVGGDVVPGPMPRETLDRLLALGPRAHFLRGNTDRLTVDAFDGRPLPSRLPPPVQEQIAWSAAQLDRAGRDALAALPLTVALRVRGLGDVRFCHASPRDDDEIFTARTPPERVRPMLAGVTERVVVCGHTHMQFDRTVDDVRLLNAGSVGMPFGRPGAYWALLGPDVTLVRTDYDREAAAERVRRTAYPHAADFAARSILDPPSEESVLAAFDRA